MKTAILEKLDQFEADLRQLRRSIAKTQSERITKQGTRIQAESLATRWVEELRSPLEHKFGLNTEVIQETSNLVKRLHVLSRPNNRKSSYLEVLDGILGGFKDKFVLPIQQTSSKVESVFDLHKLVKNLSNADDSEYLKEAVDCANDSYKRAAIVLGWCAAIDRIQKRVIAVGLQKFSNTSTTLKAQTSGRFKWFNKEFKVTTLNELQQVFDTDLITVCEGMGLLDSNQADRLVKVDFQYRNHSAHPGEAPIEDPHLVAFFTDVNEIIFTNPNFTI